MCHNIHSLLYSVFLQPFPYSWRKPSVNELHLYYCCHNNKFSVLDFSATNNSDMSSEPF